MANSEELDDRTRGVQYPVEGLEGAVRMLAEVRAAVGFSSASRDTLVEAMGYKGMSGRSARKLAALSHFDLLERVGKGTYRISDLGKRILLPVSDQDRTQALGEAARRPTLFAQVFERFKGHALPTLLPNLLGREFGVFHTSTDDAAKAFRESMEFSGLLSNGVLLEAPAENTAPPASGRGEGNATSEAGSKDDAESHLSSQGAGSASPRGGAPKEGTQRYSIALGGDGRVALIDIPVPVSPQDLRKIEKWATYMKSVLEEDEETPDAS
jgi:hypothetical protein